MKNTMVGIGAALVIMLTVFVAIFLAARDLEPTTDSSSERPTATTVIEATNTPLQITNTPTGPTTNQVADTATAIPVAPTVTPLPTATWTSIPATFTPSPTLIPPTPTMTPTSCIRRTDWPLYYVQVGDTLYLIADKTRTSAENLRLSNCLPNYNVNVGQPLYVPFLPVTATPFPTQPPPQPDVDLGTPTPTDPGAPSTEL